MKRILLLLLLGLAGCATGISETKEPVDCPRVGFVSGAFDIGTSYFQLGEHLKAHVIGEMNAKRRALLQAEKLGATHVRWTRGLSERGMETVTGEAYRCDEKAQEARNQENARNREDARNREEARKRRDEILARAEQGDAEAQFQAVMLSSSAAEQRKWFCLAVNQGHADAQFSLGVRKEFGFESYERDYAEAYMWYSLALSQGNEWAAENRHRLANKMTPEQMAEAERLVAEWTPNPAECEAEALETTS